MKITFSDEHTRVILAALRRATDLADTEELSISEFTNQENRLTGQHFKEFQRLKTFNPQTNPPKERIRYLAFDKTGWCIGDCFYGFSSSNYWNEDAGAMISRIGWKDKCWRYSNGENKLPEHFVVAFYAELPKVEL